MWLTVVAGLSLAGLVGLAFLPRIVREHRWDLLPVLFAVLALTVPSHWSYQRRFRS